MASDRIDKLPNLFDQCDPNFGCGRMIPKHEPAYGYRRAGYDFALCSDCNTKEKRPQ